jgi:NAD dependent epimerase/dehydratase family enzyme
VAPEPARHADLAEALAQALGVRCDTVVPAGQVTEMLGGAADLLLASHRMVPAKAQAAGFGYRHPGLAAAVKDLVAG